MKKLSRLGAFSVLAGMGIALGLAGCSSESSPSGTESDRPMGTAGLTLQIAPGVIINTVSYTLTGPAGFSQTGQIDVSNSTTISAVFTVPAGNGYVLTLSAVATDSTTTCAGSATFDVARGATTAVNVALRCQGQVRTGSVLVGGTINVCPNVGAVSASPLQAIVGGTISLSASANDIDHVPSPVSFAWTSANGTLTNATTASPTFTCTTVGTATIALAISDGDCGDSTTIQVSCTGSADAGVSSDGAVGNDGASSGGDSASTGPDAGGEVNLCAGVSCAAIDACHPGVCNPATGACTNPSSCQLYGTGSIPGTILDGLIVSPTTLESGSSNNQIGAFGSAIAYTGVGNLYIGTPDRGPADGTTHYTDRYYLLDLSLAGGTVTASVKGAAVLRPSAGSDVYTGFSGAFDATNSAASLRFDPEGVRVSPTGTFFASDEYGPFVYEFAANGTRLRTLTIPPKFLIAAPNATSASELPPGNVAGRQSNRGMEGLAISPNGQKLYGLMQSPLIQDGALNASNGRVGTNSRLLEIDVATGATREFLYPLYAGSYGTSEIVAINDHQFLVDERDGNAGAAAAFKKIVLVDIQGATDISATAALPSTGIPAGVTAVTKTPFLDLLASEYALAGATFPEKIEGLAFGPDLPDGRHTLVITNDNDFVSTQDNKFFVFAINPSVLPGYVAQQATFASSCATVTCSALDACHLPGTCEPSTGVCTQPVNPACAPEAGPDGGASDGSSSDTGTSDAGTTSDGGAANDAGSTSDAGVPADAGVDASTAARTFRVVRVGSGSSALTSSATAVFIEERTAAGAVVGSALALPTALSGSNRPFTLSGSASSEGGLSLSGDERYLVVAGYAATPGTSGVASTATASTNRVVARISSTGAIDTSSLLNSAFSANNVRGATSSDGTGFWVAGAGGATGGVWYVPFAGVGGTQVVSTPNNIRWLHVVGGQLFGSSNTVPNDNIFTIGSGLPTTAGQTVTSLNGLPAGLSPFSFALLDRNPGVAGLDTLYVADDHAPVATLGGIQKWTFNGTTWTRISTFTAVNAGTTPIGFRGLAATVTGANVTILATTNDATGNRIVSFVDDGVTVPTGTVLATAGTGQIYRGVALSPQN